MIREKFKLYSELLKLEHTIFALPFAFASIFILFKNFPSFQKLLYILFAFISARTLGMSINRLVDKPFDEKNPRTKLWPHVRGLVKDKEIKIIIFLSTILFIIFSYKINLLAFFLSPLVILSLIIYPYAKRFTYFPHLFLGLVYFLIPIAIDIALNERISLLAIFLGIAMATWVSGFDILYSLQDLEFDKTFGLKSIPVKFGIKIALKISKFLHFITFLSLLLMGYFYDKTTWIYFAGIGLLSIFLVYEHRLIKENDLSKINKAFFTTNGIISIIFFFIICLNYLYWLFFK